MSIISKSDGIRAEETALPAFNMATKNRSLKAGMIFHSDRGTQYASKKMVKVLVSYKIRQSISRKENYWDNAVAESFFKTLKAEIDLKTTNQNRAILNSLRSDITEEEGIRHSIISIFKSSGT
ncbi:hypothetical protein [uncultured Bacteroides sp.]|uniref:hypothetical protein n=1 Tax=uncultured Bacteroides sp. TaxID=162156 RepID=UPI003748169A